jgi:hypothetical protein
MKGLFIVVIVLVVLWFINQHTKKYEPFEIDEEESERKVELSLCDLVALIKKLLVNKHSNMNQLSHKLEPHVEQIRYELERDVQDVRQEIREDIRQEIREDVRQDLEQIMSVENTNMNIINTVEPNDDDVYSNQSLFAPI